MEAVFDLWWVFPAAVLFSTVAVGSGVSGALFFSPFFARRLLDLPTGS